MKKDILFFFKFLGGRKIILTLAGGLVILLCASFLNSFFISKKYMDVLVFSEAQAFKNIIEESYAKTKNEQDAQTLIKSSLSGYAVPKMEEKTTTVFFKFTDDTPQVIYSSKEDGPNPTLKYNNFSDKVIKAAVLARDSGRPGIAVEREGLCRFYINSMSLFKYGNDWYGAKDVVSARDVTSFSSVSVLALCALGLIFLYAGFSLILRPLYNTVGKDREQLFKILNSMGVGVRMIDAKDRKLLFANAKIKEELGDMVGKRWRDVWSSRDGSTEEVCMGDLDTLSSTRKHVLYSEKQDRWVDAYISPVVFSDGIRAVIETHIDITERKKIEKQMQMQIAIIENTKDFIAITDLDKNIVYTNPAGYKMLGYDKSAILTREGSFTPESLKLIDETGRPEVLKKGFWESDVQMVRSDGSVLDAHYSIFCLKDDGGKPYAIVSSMQDITEKLKARKQLSMQSAVSAWSINAIITLDLEGKAVFANPAFEKLLAFRKGELKLDEITPFKVHSKENAQKAMDAIAEVIKTNKPISLENEVIRNDGIVVFVLQHFFPVKDDAGNLIYVGNIINDITMQKRAETQLKLRQTVLEAAGDFIAATDTNFNGIYANPFVYEMSGYGKEEIGLDIGPYRMHDKETADKVAQGARGVLDTGKTWQSEHFLLRKDGTEIPVQQKVFILKNKDGSTRGIGTIMRDISALKEVQEEIAEVKERLEIALKSSKAGVWEIDFEKSIGKYDSAAAELFDLDKNKSEMTFDEARPILRALFDDEQGKHFLSLLAQRTFSEEDVTHEFKRIKHRDGTINYVTTYGHPVTKDGKIVGAIGMTIDVTDRHNLEEELLKVTDRLESALKSSNAGVWEFDYAERMVRIDEICSKIYNVNLNGKYELSFDDLISYVESNMVGSSAKFWTGVLRAGNMPREDHSPANNELKIKWPDNTYHYVDIFWKNSYDEAGNLIRTTGMSVDVTQRHEMEGELRKAKEAAEHANKAKSQFLSNMSHEIRTPMNAIIGMTRIAKEADDLKKVRSSLEKVEASSAHLLDIINTILDLSKIDSGKFDLINEEFDLERLLVDLINVVSVKADEKHQNLFVRIDNNVPRNLFGDSMRLGQVIMNLLSNAIKFTSEEGKVSLGVKVKNKTGKNITLEFVVSDTGIGMTPDQLKNLFQAFEQADKTITKRFGGTGLGLAISKRIVKLMNGEISVASEFGAGSEFRFTVVLEVTGDEKELVSDIMLKYDRSKINILVVDDSSEIREYMASILSSHNLKCETACNGYEALEKVNSALSEQDSFNIIFMDYKMEGMDGLETSRKIKAIKQGNSVVIMMSIYEMEKIEKEARAIGIRNFLAKPIFPSTIINTINDIMGFNSITKKVTKEEVKKLKFNFKSILIVEDMEINREILSNILKDSKVKITMAADGVEAVSLFKRDPHAFDLILMDVQMPEMDGYTATKLIRTSGVSRATEIPIIALTANAFKEDIDAALAAGMNGHLTKPIDDKKLFTELSKYLGSEEEIKENTMNSEETKANTYEPIDSKIINLKTGLSILNKNTKLYLRLLESFVKNGLVEEFVSAIERKDIAASELKAHTVKGVAANLSLDTLREIFQRIDDKLKKNVLLDVNSADVQEAKEIYKKTLKAIDTILANPIILEKFKEENF